MEDTICAVSTAMSDAGIGIIRVSGQRSIEITDSIFTDGAGRHRLMLYDSNTINHGYIRDPADDSVVDEVLVSIMRAPHSYTCEDVVEINCHGGRFLLNRVLDILISRGCRVAEPGEFTKRAYLNGRLDLTEAEAVMDVISSQSEFALKNAQRQLRGDLAEQIESFRKTILHETARIEAAIDDPEAYDLGEYRVALRDILSGLLMKLKKLHDTSDLGMIFRDGIDTVILGRPNAGKSSLFNRLAGQERAIVTDIPGTTRDVLQEKVIVTCGREELILNLSDTAGIRDSSNMVESIGIDRALDRASGARLIICVLDGSDPDPDSDNILPLNELKSISSPEKKYILLINKSDLGRDTDISNGRLIQEMTAAGIDEESYRIITSSMTEEGGLDELYKTIGKFFLTGGLEIEQEFYITNTRHKNILKRAMDSLKNVIKTIDMGYSEDLFYTDMMAAYTALGEIVGGSDREDLADEIFSSFCMGK